MFMSVLRNKNITYFTVSADEVCELLFLARYLYYFYKCIVSFNIITIYKY